MHLGLSLSATWWRGGTWRREGSRIEELFSPALFTQLAQRAEAAKLDFVFKPDALQLDAGTLATWPGFASLEPIVMMAAIATHTKHIGLVPTISATFADPYATARQLQSLNHVSGGRAGWNVVTSLSGERNHGLEAMPSSDQRHARAEAFVHVVRRLFASWPHDAQLIDRAAGRYADASRVLPIDVSNEHFSVAGPLSLPQHGPEPLPLLHAGGSEGARRLAARQADAVFASAIDIEDAQAQRRSYADLAMEAGRRADAVRLMPGFAFTLARTREEARELDELAHGPTTTGAERPPQPRRQVHGGVVGTPDDAYQAIVAWFEAGAADGFILLPGGALSSLELFLDEVVPRLVDAGLFRSDYRGSTLADHLGIRPEGAD